MSVYQNKRETKTHLHVCVYTHTQVITLYTDFIPHLVIQGYKIIMEMNFPLSQNRCSQSP